MTILTHLVVTALAAQALHLEGRDLLLAYAFGVAPDLDHLLKVPLYLRSIGWQRRPGYHWRTSFQEPVALLWIVPLSMLLATAVPVVFFALHVAMDYAVGHEKLPLYPYSRYVTRGWLPRIPDRVKEGALLLCTILLLVWSRR